MEAGIESGDERLNGRGKNWPLSKNQTLAPFFQFQSGISPLVNSAKVELSVVPSLFTQFL